MTRKHFKKLAEIIAKHNSRMEDNSDPDLFNDIVSFCASENQYFQLDTFANAVEENRKELKCQI
jgi:hypothetical protein